MKNIARIALGATALVCAAGGADAYTRHPSTAAERAQTKALNDQQLQLAKEENTGLAINASATGTDASAGLAANSATAATPATPVQQVDAGAARPAGSDPGR